MYVIQDQENITGLDDLSAMRVSHFSRRVYLHETRTNSDWHEFVSSSVQFFLCIYMRPARQ